MVEGETTESRRVADALQMAAARRRQGAGPLARSDRRGPYAIDHNQRAPAGAGVACRMSGVGQRRDNAPVESFFGGHKRELGSGDGFATRDQGRAEIFEYREVIDSRVRLHSSPGSLSPAEFERTYHSTRR